MRPGKHFVDWLSKAGDEFYDFQELSRLFNEKFLELDGERGFARVSFDIDQRFCNFKGTVHGGIISTILDEAVGVAAFCLVGDRFRSTIEAKVSYFKPVKPGTLIVEAHTAYKGPSALFMEASVLDKGSRVIARSSSTIACWVPNGTTQEPQ